MKHRRRVVARVTVLLCLGAAGCHQTVNLPAPGSMVVLVDRTASVSGRISSDYSRYFNSHIAASLAPGQRLLVESITDESTLSNPPLRVVDTTLSAVQVPPFRVSDDYRSYERRCRTSVVQQAITFQQTRNTAIASAQKVFSGSQLATSTFIVDGVEDAAETLRHGPQPHRLVLFTDGIEDSSESGLRLKFDESAFWQAHRPEALVEELKRQRRVPDLQGTHVYLIGAAARRPELFRITVAFWKAFFTAAGVTEADLHYGHSPSWEEAALPEKLDDYLCKSDPLR